MGQVYIVNLGKERWEIARTYVPGVAFVIRPCQEDESFHVTPVVGQQPDGTFREKVDLGDDRFYWNYIKPEEAAQDLLQGLHNFGVFISTTNPPSKEALAEASVIRQRFLDELIGEADANWAANRDMRTNGITQVHTRACIERGLEREWCFQPKRQNPCPFCSMPVMEAVAICRHCNAILDVDKAELGGLINPEQAASLREARSNRAQKKAGRPPGTKTRPIVEQPTA